MIAGQLNKRITIQYKVVAQDTTYGSDVVTWTDFATDVPANVQDALPSNSESVKNGLVMSANPSRVRIPYIPGIDSSMRVVVHGERERTCDIIAGPAELGSREGFEMMIMERSS